jgi:hypothetical protein
MQSSIKLKDVIIAFNLEYRAILHHLQDQYHTQFHVSCVSPGHHYLKTATSVCNDFVVSWLHILILSVNIPWGTDDGLITENESL